MLLLMYQKRESPNIRRKNNEWRIYRCPAWDHWVKSNIETNVQRLLSTTDKLTFDSNGIALLDTTVANVLETAFNNGIVDIVDETGVGNYSVTALGRQDLNPDDIAARNYKGLSFKYKRSGAIHTVDVTGTIEV